MPDLGTRWLEVRVTRYQWGGRTEWARPSFVGSLGTRAMFLTVKDAPERPYYAQFYRTIGTMPVGAYGTRHYRYATEGSYNTRITEVGTWA